VPVNAVPTPAGSMDAPRYKRGVSGGRLLLSDLRTLRLFANEARYRGFERTLGLPRDQANLATAVALLAVIEAARQRATRFHVPAPTLSGFAFGNAALREVILGPPKPGAPPVPVFSGLLAIAAGGTVVVAAGKSLGGVRGAARAFAHRYGHHARTARGTIAGKARRLSPRE